MAQGRWSKDRRPFLFARVLEHADRLADGRGPIARERRRHGAGRQYTIRVYTIGMGELVRYMLGTMPEKPEDILMRIANDSHSADFNSAQLEGKYYYAKTEADVGPAFEALQNQIVRLSK